jgi:hypothetical protein
MDGTPCLDYLPTLVYPEACHSMPQQDDRDAVFVFLGD